MFVTFVLGMNGSEVTSMAVLLPFLYLKNWMQIAKNVPAIHSHRTSMGLTVDEMSE